MFPVTRPILPDLERYGRYLERAHARAWLTNFGPLHEELTERLEDFLGVRNLLLVANGTLALQIAYRTFGLQGRVLTTPFSYLATTSSLAWEGLEPAFVDIDPATFNLDPVRLEAAEPGSGVVAVHVFGNPCDVEEIERIAAERGMPVIYDAAHAFGSTYKGESLLKWGDAATLSFHATKIFHTVEGGAIVFRDEARFLEARALMNFGQGPGETLGTAGTNAKLSEYHAAAGLALFDEMPRVLAHRAELVGEYSRSLAGWVEFQQWDARGRNNAAYMPVLLSDEAQCLRLQSQLLEEGVETRRYFHPSLNMLDWGRHDPCPVGEDVASRILCLPLYADLRIEEAREIAEKVKGALASGNRGGHAAGP